MTYSLLDLDAPSEDVLSQPLLLGLNLPRAPEQTPPQTVSPLFAPHHQRIRSTRSTRQRLLKVMPWLLSGSILTLDLVIHAPLFVLGAGIFSLTSLMFKAIARRVPLIQRWLKALLKRLGVADGVPPTMSVGVAGGAWLSASSPSNALFFQAAEQYFQTTFGAGGSAAATAIPLVFGSLRVIFVLYLAIALVRVINAFRQDEDWVTAARIPMMVVLCVVLGDVLSTLIVQ